MKRLLYFALWEAAAAAAFGTPGEGVRARGGEAAPLGLASWYRTRRRAAVVGERN